MIPAGEGEMQLARRLGYRDVDPDAALGALSGRHAAATWTPSPPPFAALFYNSQRDHRRGRRRSRTRRCSPASTRIRRRPTRALAALGFRDPRSAREHLVLLRDGAPSSPATPRRKQLLLAVAPALLGEVTRAPDPDLALRHLAGFITAIGARSSFLVAAGGESRPRCACWCGSSARASSCRRS